MKVITLLLFTGTILQFSTIAHTLDTSQKRHNNVKINIILWSKTYDLHIYKLTHAPFELLLLKNCCLWKLVYTLNVLIHVSVKDSSVQYISLWCVLDWPHLHVSLLLLVKEAGRNRVDSDTLSRAYLRSVCFWLFSLCVSEQFQICLAFWTV